MFFDCVCYSGCLRALQWLLVCVAVVVRVLQWLFVCVAVVARVCCDVMEWVVCEQGWTGFLWSSYDAALSACH